MPVIRVDMLKGRTIEQKRELAKEFTESYLRICGGQREGVNIVLTDVEHDHWAVGGTLCSER